MHNPFQLHRRGSPVCPGRSWSGLAVPRPWRSRVPFSMPFKAAAPAVRARSSITRRTVRAPRGWPGFPATIQACRGRRRLWDHPSQAISAKADPQCATRPCRDRQDGGSGRTTAPTGNRSGPHKPVVCANQPAGDGPRLCAGQRGIRCRDRAQHHASGRCWRSAEYAGSQDGFP
jgi:hypothetical protein